MTAMQERGCLGIIAGGGVLPLTIAEAVTAAGRPVHILGLSQLADPRIERFSHSWIRWGQIGRMLRILRVHGCKDIVIIGGVRRPRLRDLRIDFGAVRNAYVLWQLTRGGDDKVLSGVVKFFERQGFCVRGAHEVVPQLVAPAGILTNARPSADDEADIAYGFRIVRAMGALDVGQAAVVARGYALAVEAAEGTDEMLRRCQELRQWGFDRRMGVLVKTAKPGQELRVDMPTIGPRTVELAAGAGLSGIAVGQGEVLLAEAQELIRIADNLGLFVVGVEQAAHESHQESILPGTDSAKTAANAGPPAAN